MWKSHQETHSHSHIHVNTVAGTARGRLRRAACQYVCVGKFEDEAPYWA